MIKKLFDKDYVRFVIVGVLNTVIGTSVMFLSYNLLRFGYWPSSALNYIVGSIFSYFANKYFTFKQQEKSIKEIVRFILNISLCYLLAYGIAQSVISYALGSFFGVSNKRVIDQVSMVMGMGLFVVLNYLGQKVFVFRKQKE